MWIEALTLLHLDLKVGKEILWKALMKMKANLPFKFPTRSRRLLCVEP